METLPYFSSVLKKHIPGFQFISTDDRALPKWDLLLQDRMCFYGSKFFPLTVEPY